MPKQPASLALRFVELALRPNIWKEAAQLPEEDVKTLFEVVTAAGFEPEAVVFGKLRGDYREQDGSSTGETYPINGVCHYKVVGEGGDNYLATGWLDCAVREALEGAGRFNRSSKEIAKTIQEEIEQSMPLTPVQITPEGDMLLEYPPRLSFGAQEYFVEHSRDEDECDDCAGIHKFCGGWVDRKRATATHDSLNCRSCRMRVLFPREIKTYGQLREALSAKLALANA